MVVKCMFYSNFCTFRAVPHLQLFDGLSSLADDQADLVCGDEDLLDRAVAIHVAVEAGAVPTLLHNLTQQPLGLAVGGGARNTFVTTYRLHTKKKLSCVAFLFVHVKEVFR